MRGIFFLLLMQLTHNGIFLIVYVKLCRFRRRCLILIPDAVK